MKKIFILLIILFPFVLSATEPAAPVITETITPIQPKDIIENPTVFDAQGGTVDPTTTETPKGEYVPITPKIGATENSNVYKMLVPLPGITCMDNTGKDPNCIGNNIMGYLNFIFKFGIGLCAALAVIMLIVYGVMYMGDESVFGKTAAKEKMLGAILGLFIAIGAWVLLNTINPDLTGKNGFNIAKVNVKIEPLYDIGYNDPKNSAGESIRCTPVTNPGSPCTVANLTPIFGEKAIAMSKICNMESSGVSQASGTDYCNPPGKSLPFSFGLFQVNLAANGILAGEDCAGLFDRAVRGKDATSAGGYTCSLLPGKEALYNKCKNILLNDTKNLEIAKSLFLNSNGMGNWLGDKKYCASAFQ